MKLQLYPTFYRILLFVFVTLSPAIVLAQPSMRANLHIVAANGTTVLMDGNLTNYDNIYSNSLDMYDAWKMNNFSENFGILRSNSVLVIERRKDIGACDTTFFKMWNMQYRNYRLQVITKNFNQTGLTAYVLDKFLQTKTLVKINDTTLVNFTVNTNPGSWDAQRFQIIYTKPDMTLQFVSLSSARVNNAIALKWTVANERNITKYIVEHSFNGMHFTDAAELPSANLGNNTYEFAPKNSLVTDNYYRIKAIHNNGTTYYSLVTKIAGEVITAGLFPNPVTERTFFIKMAGINNQSILQLVGLAGNGVKLSSGNIMETGADLIKVTVPAQVSPGFYKLKITLADRTTQVVSVRIL